ncbi:hypothetical protein D6792_00735 [Candidatus Parcubacteria bacterium]|nr:MAG: hypothetical protein D6792_00735 [Candidatus Parcubacteria bacterium]
MQHTYHLPEPPNLPPEFQQLRDELVWGIQSLMEHWGLDTLTPDEFEETITSIAEAVYASAMAELFGRYPERIAAFLQESEQAFVERDETAFVRVLAEHFPDFPEVFAQVAARLVEETEAMLRERIAHDLAYAGLASEEKENTT